MAIEIVVGIGVAALLLGLLIGYFIPSGGAKKARVTELENALESAQEELADYKRPRKIEIRFDEFEKTTTQKIKRYLYAIDTTGKS